MDPHMMKMVGGLSVPYICMHMQGQPENMQKAPFYENVVSELLDFFLLKKAQCKDAGIHDLILDPGFGFGKTIAHNFQILHNLGVFKIRACQLWWGCPEKLPCIKPLVLRRKKHLMELLF